jgi:hypothetical protein
MSQPPLHQTQADVDLIFEVIESGSLATATTEDLLGLMAALDEILRLKPTGQEPPARSLYIYPH